MKENYYKLDKKHLSVYFKLLVISLLYVLPIIIANVCYNDDMARTLYGLTGWNGDGRPLGEMLIKLLCGGEPIVDIAPLPLILSIAVLSYALVVYARSYLDFISNEYVQVVLLATVLMNPFAMSNLSYRFDCIIMFMALSIPFLLFAMPDTTDVKGNVKVFIYSLVSGAVVMSLYQPVLGMCIALFIIHFFFVITGRKTAWAGIWKIGGIGVGVIFYKLVIAKHFVSSEDWRYEASTVVDINIQSIRTVLDNVTECIRYIKDFFRQTSSLYQVLLGVIIVLSIATMLFSYLKTSKSGRGHKIWRAVLIVVSPALVFIAAFLPLALLDHMGLRSRIFISFGSFLLFMGIMLLYANQKRKYAALLLGLCLACQSIYMYSYGNALKCQNEYEQYMVYSIVHDVETLNADGEYSEISFIGQMPRARQLTMTCNKYPFFNEIVPVYVDNSTWIGGAWVYHYMQNDMTITALSEVDMEAVNTVEPVMQNARYSCYVNDNKILILFH